MRVEVGPARSRHSQARIFSDGVGAWLLVTSTEEIAFRGYVLREVLQSLRGRKGGSAVALAVSSSAFALFHIAIPGTGLDSTTANFMVQALVSGLLFGLTYWLTGWNLSVSVMMHFFYDAFGGVLNSNPFDQLWPYRVIFVFILLPSLAAITIHQVMKRARKDKGIMTTQTDEPGREL
jgi:membrane protease YdiL (CAAX protease family)